MNAFDPHVHSGFSILDGMGKPKDVVDRGVELGWGAVCLTEHGWMGSAPQFYQAAKAAKINPIIGCEFYIAPHEVLGLRGKEYRWKFNYHLTVLALTAEGYHNLVAWTTWAHKRENFYDRPRISLDAMAEIAPYGLHHNVVLSGCVSSELCVTLAEANGSGVDVGAAYVASMKSLFPNFYIEIQNHRRSKFLGIGLAQYEDMVKREIKMRAKLIEIAKATNTPLVLANDSHFQKPQQREAHIALIAGKQRKGWGEYVYATSYMQSMEKIAERTEHGEECIRNLTAIQDEARIELDPLDRFQYSIPFSGYKDPVRAIRKRAKSRLAALVKEHGKPARDRFEHELESMGDFAHYLLIMSDLIIYAKKQGILTNTRGSAAGSLLNYCLKIHDIDPMPDAYDLLFSRFFNPARKKLPDIDIDIQASRYDDFMKYVHDYMREREGDEVVQICNYGTLANRSAFRHVAEALGVPKEVQDEISKILPQMIDSGMVEEENDAYEMLKHEYPELYDLAAGVFDQIRNVSQHACGWLFGTKERPISKWVPLVLITSSGVQVTAYNLKALDDFGMVKGDFLRLRSLDVIQKTLRATGRDAIEINEIPLDDPETFEMFRNGDTEGVFTLQGKENRRGCMEVEVENVHDVIKTVAIYRPALTRVGMHTEYNNRRRGDTEVEYVHAIEENILGPTYGIPVFQEQVMELCYAVGMSDLEVDEVYQAIKLAKGVGRGAKEAFGVIRPKFKAAAKRSGFDKHTTRRLWERVVSSQGYGFNKAHASSYGIFATRSGYLRKHSPAEFHTSLLDVYPEKAKYVSATRAAGFQFLYPSVNRSGSGFSFDRDSGKILVGLSRVKGLGPVGVSEIVRGQPYSSYEDFRERVQPRSCNSAAVEALQAVGAFSELGLAPKEHDDNLEFEIIGMTIKKPKALKNLKPKHCAPRTSDGGWSHAGLERGIELTEPRTSVSKLFWIPEFHLDRKNKIKGPKFELKASPYAHVKTYLLTVIDENGVAFQIMANEDKEGEAIILEKLAGAFRGASVCLDGAVRQPFLTDGPMGFRFYNVTGAYFHKDPQVWHVPGKDKLKRKGLVELHEIKRRLRYA
jgi:DNA polymerase-3 subunit alpha